MDDKIKLIVPETKHVGADNTDQNQKIYLESDRTDFVDSDRNIRVDLAEQFNIERQDSEKYRLYGKVTPLFVNSYTGTTTYESLLNSMWLTSTPLTSTSSNYAGYPPYNEFAFTRTDVTRDVPVSGDTTMEVVGNNHIEIFTHNANDINWNTYISYVYDINENIKLKYTDIQDNVLEFNVNEGIPIEITFDNKQRICMCESPVNHGLSETDHVLIKGKLLKIDSLGTNVFGSEKKVFNLQLSQISGSSITEGLHTFKRVIDSSNISESTSSYYIHKHKIISNLNDFIIDKCGFESSIFEDQYKLEFENPDGRKEVLKEKERGEVLLYHYKKALERLGYKNNFNTEINEVFITVLNRNGMGFFTPPKVGYSFNFHDLYTDHHFSGDTSIETGITYSSVTVSGRTFYTGNSVVSGTTFTGAFVEYNKYELKERVISEAFHRFSFVKELFDHGQDDPNVYPNTNEDNMFGYFYQPHYRIKLKDYSSYIEDSTTDDIDNFPKNAIYFLKDKVWRWRELYNHGFIDDNGVGVDYPFINGVHYIKFNIPFYIRSEFHYVKKDKVLTPFTNKKYRNGC